MPPDHGAAIAHEILENSALRESWLDEVASMRKRIQGLRQDVVQQLGKVCPQRDFGFIETQHGMFSYLGITVEQVRALQTQHHVYMTDDSRVNIAGLRAENIEYFAQALAKVLSA
jgi:aspartate/tyrosine/aromatic aminotransferase